MDLTITLEEGKHNMSIQEVSAEQLARLFNHHYKTHAPDSNSIDESWSEIPLGERSRMIAAVRLALQDLGSSNCGTSSRNERYLLNALVSSVVQIRDLGILVEFSYHHGLTEVTGKHPDIIMSSDSLLHCLSYDWGGECLAINGRYEVPRGGHPQLFFWIFRVPAHNRLGSTFDLAFLARQAVMRTVRAIAPQG